MPERQEHTLRDAYKTPIGALRWTVAHMLPIRRGHVLKDLVVNCLYYGSATLGILSFNQSISDPNSTGAIGERLPHVLTIAEDPRTDPATTRRYRELASSLLDDLDRSRANAGLLVLGAAAVFSIATRLEKRK